MLGWRARIGWIRPRRGSIHAGASEVARLLPDGVIVQDFYLSGPKSLTPEHLREVHSQIEPAARELSQVSPDVIFLGGAPIGIVNGLGTDKKIIEVIEKSTGVAATTSITSIVRALEKLNVRKVVAIAPYYSEEIGEMLRTFLEGSGFDVVSLVRGEGRHISKVSDVAQEHTYRLAKAAFLKAPAADGLLLVGDVPTSGIIQILETDLGRPVVASTFAALWDILSMASVRQPIGGCGRLLTMF